jgi:hypothetical protein
MSKSQRTKGAVFEREVCDLFSAYLGRKITRNIGQARDGGNDIDVGCFAVECKKRASLKGLRAWMQQASDAARTRAAGEVARRALQQGFSGTFASVGEYGKHIPIVVMREDGGEEPMVLMNWSGFLYLCGPQIDGEPTA